MGILKIYYASKEVQRKANGDCILFKRCNPLKLIVLRDYALNGFVFFFVFLDLKR